MKGVVCPMTAVVAFSVMTAAATVGDPLSEVVVPIEAVTVAEKDILHPSYDDIRKTALEDPSEAKRLAAVDALVDQPTLVSVIRKDESSAVRMKAFSKIVDGDQILRLVFKPGLQGVSDVRPAAVRQLAEVELVRAFSGENCPDEKTRAAAVERLKSVFGTDRDRASAIDRELVGANVRRSKRQL